MATQPDRRPASNGSTRDWIVQDIAYWISSIPLVIGYVVVVGVIALIGGWSFRTVGLVVVVGVVGVTLLTRFIRWAIANARSQPPSTERNDL
ncbi:MAG: hypothetical protein AAFP84_00345 [Actinomycetota bacterium]